MALLRMGKWKIGRRGPDGDADYVMGDSGLGFDEGYDRGERQDDGYDAPCEEDYEDYGAPYADEPYDDGYAEDYDGDYAEDYDGDYAGPYGEDYGDAPDDGLAGRARALLYAALDFLDAHEWISFVLLAALPPVGIWLLWYRRRFVRRGRIVLSTLSGLWCVALILLLFVHPFRPRSDVTFTPTSADAQTQTAQPDGGPEGVTVTEAEPVDDADAVYVAQNASFYHGDLNCEHVESFANVSRVSTATAQAGNLLACPYCLAGQYSVWDVVFMTAEDLDRSGIRVYCTAKNENFHVKADCGGIENPQQIGLKEALMMGRTACDTCCASAGRIVYCTNDGTYCHVDSTCSGMKNARPVTYAEARVIGKKRCPKCIGGSDDDMPTADAGATETSDSTYYVYATKNGTFYHIDEHCSGMKNAARVPLRQMLDSGRPACPVCCANADHTVYAERGGAYYHSNATCSGMTRPIQGTLVSALAASLQRCPVCWTSATAGTT